MVNDAMKTTTDKYTPINIINEIKIDLKHDYDEDGMMMSTRIIRPDCIFQVIVTHSVKQNELSLMERVIVFQCTHSDDIKAIKGAFENILQKKPIRVGFWQLNYDSHINDLNLYPWVLKIDHLSEDAQEFIRQVFGTNDMIMEPLKQIS